MNPSQSTSPCPRTEAVAQAARHGHLAGDAVLATHASGCSQCSEHLWLDELFASDALALEDAAPVEDPRLLWLRARLEGREERTHRATWAIRAIEKLTLAAGAIGAMALAVWAWPQLGLDVAAPLTDAVASTANVPGDPLTPLALVAALALAATAGDFYDRWSRA